MEHCVRCGKPISIYRNSKYCSDNCRRLADNERRKTQRREDADQRARERKEREELRKIAYADDRRPFRSMCEKCRFNPDGRKNKNGTDSMICFMCREYGIVP